MPVYQHNPDGSWTEAVPLGPQTRLAHIEWRLRDRGLRRLSRLLGELDELPLRFGR